MFRRRRPPVCVRCLLQIHRSLTLSTFSPRLRLHCPRIRTTASHPRRRRDRRRKSAAHRARRRAEASTDTGHDRRCARTTLLPFLTSWRRAEASTDTGYDRRRTRTTLLPFLTSYFLLFAIPRTYPSHPGINTAGQVRSAAYPYRYAHFTETSVLDSSRSIRRAPRRLAASGGARSGRCGATAAAFADAIVGARDAARTLVAPAAAPAP